MRSIKHYEDVRRLLALLVAPGDTAEALDALEDAMARHVPGLVWLRVTPELAPLRSDPRFASLLQRLDGP